MLGALHTTDSFLADLCSLLGAFPFVRRDRDRAPNGLGLSIYTSLQFGRAYLNQEGRNIGGNVSPGNPLHGYEQVPFLLEMPRQSRQKDVICRNKSAWLGEAECVMRSVKEESIPTGLLEYIPRYGYSVPADCNVDHIAGRFLQRMLIYVRPGHQKRMALTVNAYCHSGHPEATPALETPGLRECSEYQ